MAVQHEKRSAGEAPTGSHCRAFPRYAFMARVSNFTCNNETRCLPYKGSGWARKSRWSVSRVSTSKARRWRRGRRSWHAQSSDDPLDHGSTGIRDESTRQMESTKMRLNKEERACSRSFYDSHAHHRRPRDRRRPLQTLTTDITSKKASHELISSSSWSENHPAKRGPFDFACHLPKRSKRSHFPIHGSRFFWYLVYKYKNRCSRFSVQSLIFDELYNHRMEIPMKLHRHLGKWVHLSSRCSRYSLEFNQTRCFAHTYANVHRYVDLCTRASSA